MSLPIGHTQALLLGADLDAPALCNIQGEGKVVAVSDRKFIRQVHGAGKPSGEGCGCQDRGIKWWASPVPLGILVDRPVKLKNRFSLDSR
jgi:hypothetical protein